MKHDHLIGIYTKCFRENWTSNAFSDFQGSTTTFGEAAQIIRQIHCYFREAGIQKGDKIAILGRNSSNWAISASSIWRILFTSGKVQEHAAWSVRSEYLSGRDGGQALQLSIRSGMWITEREGKMWPLSTPILKWLKPKTR